MADNRGKANALLSRMGYAKGGDVAQDKAMIHKHERNMHPGKPLTKLATGGAVGEYARGGATKAGSRNHGKRPTHVKVNVNVMPAESAPPAMPPMMGKPPMPPPAAMGPPGPGAGLGGPPGLGMGPKPPMPVMRRGGGVKAPEMTGGAGGGRGRLEKVKAYG